MTKKLRVGIIGFGKMGALHAKGYTNAEVEIMGIMDEHAPENIYPIFNDINLFLDAVDIISICTPSSTHMDIALQCIEAGKPVLVEKPLAMDIGSCEKIINKAKENNVKVSVGHIERYNAGFKAILDNIDKIGQIEKITAVRTNPSSNRITDVDVLTDLTVHDLDLIRTLCGGHELEDVQVKHKLYNQELGFLDSIKATFLLNDIVIKVHTCRVAEDVERSLKVVGKKGTIVADLINRSATLNGEELNIAPIDQIDAQLSAWVSANVNNTDPVVSMYDGMFAVTSADVIRRSQ